MSNSLHRQIIDIQMQAERILKEKVSLEDIDQFNSYNEEIKNYLLGLIKDKFIIDRVLEIPNLNLDSDSPNTSFSFLSFLSFLVGGSISKERSKVEEAKYIIRDIKDKYASLEFILKNNGF